MKTLKGSTFLTFLVVMLAMSTGCSHDNNDPVDPPAAAATITVSGKNLVLAGGQSFVLRGINYPIIDEGLPTLGTPARYKFKIDEAAKTGANAIRIQWYTNGTHFMDDPEEGTPGTVDGLLNNGTLSDIIGYCYEKGMIPILVIQNTVCSNDWNYFNNVAIAWWQKPAVIDLINKHKKYLIANIACEFGDVEWAADPVAAQGIFKNNYIQAVQKLRNAGITIPLMIDAPDCGRSSSALARVAKDILNADPRKNIIFSAHTYWTDYANTAAAVKTKLDEINNTGTCFVFGEVGNWQDDNVCCVYDITNLYRIILGEACSRGIGWLAWSYSQDCCKPREMTTNGEFGTLTPYGNDIINNATYGLKSGGSCAAQPLPR
ncbi:cellulase family glycosylhydrolase [Chitinophaga sp.]|uniref:cellulase family glycosylhydrolase n=1 Tax=Chitinophaga sp. TaxID=1869181 RepID=UPI002F930006